MLNQLERLFSTKRDEGYDLNNELEGNGSRTAVAYL
jgi:hypothetical protein